MLHVARRFDDPEMQVVRLRQRHREVVLIRIEGDALAVPGPREADEHARVTETERLLRETVDRPLTASMTAPSMVAQKNATGGKGPIFANLPTPKVSG